MLGEYWLFHRTKFLFSSVIEAIKRKENILPMLERSLKRIEDSTLGQDSEEDFGGLFSDIDLASLNWARQLTIKTRSLVTFFLH